MQRLQYPALRHFFSNERPDTDQLAIDRLKLLYITDDNLEEKQEWKKYLHNTKEKETKPIRSSDAKS